MAQQQKNIVIMASGAGSNAAKIIERFRNHPVIKVVAVVSSRKDAGVNQVAASHNVPLIVLERPRFLNEEKYLTTLLIPFQPDLIVLAGFLWLLPVDFVRHFDRRIINIHPSLLPQYGGRGMYGMRVHEAVIGNRDKESGITIHYVDEEYDRGDIIRQVNCPIEESDDPALLAEKIHRLEHRHYPEVIEEILLS